ncbi:MAG: hypothetical protein JXB10_04880 [Pirellulales bacterium]|nr:hypothetical protein [Pirellulales bacterium]
MPDNELFSAYLDGELTAAEQAEFERLLAENSAARQLLDELRAVSRTLQSLSAQKLSEDLREPVLRIAQQRMLTEPAPPTGAPSVLPRPFVERWKNSRLWIWPGIVVAVALLLWIVIPEPRELPVPGGGPIVARKDESKKTTELKRGSEAAAESVAADREKRPKSDYTFCEPASPPAKGAPPYSAKAASRPSRTAGREIVRSKAFGAEPLPAEDSSKGSQSSFDFGFGARGGMGGIQRKGEVHAGTVPAEPSAGEGLLVVQCDISPEAESEKPFEKLLAENRIPLVDADQPAAEELADTSHDAKNAPSQPAVTAPPEVLAYETQKEMPPLDLVYVEAPPAQVESLLQAINSDVKNFTAVQVMPTQDVPQQRRLVHFNRGLKEERLAAQSGQSVSGRIAAGAAFNEKAGKPAGKAAPKAGLPPKTPAYSPLSIPAVQEIPPLQNSNFAQRIPLSQRSVNAQKADTASSSVMGDAAVQEALQRLSPTVQQSVRSRQSLQTNSLALEGAAPQNQQVLFVLRRAANTSEAAVRTMERNPPPAAATSPVPSKGQ